MNTDKNQTSPPSEPLPGSRPDNITPETEKAHCCTARLSGRRREKNKVKRRGPGRPKTEITPAEMRRIGRYAEQGAQNGTICEKMGWADSWMDGRQDIREYLRKKRAEGKIKLHAAQYRKAMSADTTMMIWLGKNRLEQTDKQQHDMGEETLSAIMALAARILRREGMHK